MLILGLFRSHSRSASVKPYLETLDQPLRSFVDMKDRNECFSDFFKRKTAKERWHSLGRVRLGYSGIRIYSGIYSSYSAPGSRIGGMEIQVIRNENSSQTNASSHYSTYSHSGLISNERALSFPYGWPWGISRNALPFPPESVRTFARSVARSVVRWRHNQIFSAWCVTNFSYPWCFAGALRALKLRY